VPELSQERKRCIYCPHSYQVFATLALVVTIILVLVYFGVIGFAFSGVGFNPTMVVALLLGTLFGSIINIPLFKIENSVPIVRDEFINFFGLSYRVPRIHYDVSVTTIAVNVGGALIPSVACIYLLAQSPPMTIIYSLIGVVIVAAVTKFIAKPVKGVGIMTPAFVSPLVAAVFAVLISPSSALVVAYVSGVLGTLIGADLLNLGKLGSLGAPVASIGGAGTFDGVFLSGIIAVVIAAL
jgi:uncharacterized membrane protein